MHLDRLSTLEELTSDEGDSRPCPVAGGEVPPGDRGGRLATIEAEFRAAKERALAEAEHLRQLKTEFVNNMHHELRTPLYGILGMATVGMRANDVEKSRHACRRILEAGRRLAELVENVLDFAQLEAGHGRVRPEPTALRKPLEAVARRALASATAKGLGFEHRHEGPQPACCVIDGHRLEGILDHLLDNAVKFTDEGRVTLVSGRDGDQLVFVVADTGIGMGIDHVRQLFRPFEQANGSTSRRFGGMGLGLALTERVGRLMGGTIRVESTPGQGSRFEVRLPYVEAVDADLE